MAAFESIADARALQLRVLRYVTSRLKVGATCDEVEAALGLRHQTASARINELVGKGYLANSDAQRRNRSGRLAIVWVSKYPKSSDPVQGRLFDV
jgi:DNA-binding IclR family transcriptional regulator